MHHSLWTLLSIKNYLICAAKTERLVIAKCSDVWRSKNGVKPSASNGLKCFKRGGNFIRKMKSKVTMFGKLKLGDRFTKDGFSGIFTKTGEKESWSPKHRMLLFLDTMVRKID